MNANKQLIEIFEQKIKDRIAKVWGSPATQSTEEENTVEEQVLDMAAESKADYGRD